MKTAVLAVNGGMSIAKASTEFNVPCSTLQLKARGWKGRTPTLNNLTAGGRKRTFSVDEEESLAGMLKTMSKWGFGLGKHDVLDVIQEFVVKNKVKTPFKGNRPGREWFVAFCRRHSLSLKKPELLEGSRSRQSNDPFIINDFFHQLETVIKELNLEKLPSQIYNADESGFRSDPTTTKVVSTRGQPAKRVTGGNARKTTTVLACVNAQGHKLPPLILHKGNPTFL